MESFKEKFSKESARGPARSLIIIQNEIIAYPELLCVFIELGSVGGLCNSAQIFLKYCAKILELSIVNKNNLAVKIFCF